MSNEMHRRAELDVPAVPGASTRRRAARPRRCYGGVPIFVLVAGAVLVLLVWFGTLGVRHLVSSDEGRYAEIAREMFISGDWVTIRYNALKYFEKPPFHLWVTSLAYAAFGIGEWQARLCVALSGMAGLLATMLAARRWFGRRAAWQTGLVLLAAPIWNVGAHFNALDMTLGGALACVLACMLMACHPVTSRAARLGWMLGCWAAMAVAVLSKGLVGIVLPGLVLVIYSLVRRDIRIWARLEIVPGLLLFLAIVTPWFWLVQQRNPEFFHFFFVHEHWERYTSTVHSRRGPLWYFVPLLLAGFLPWLGLFPGMWKAVMSRAGTREARAASTPPMSRGGGEAAGPSFEPALLAAIWAIAIFGFFSLSGSKLPGYIIPVFPALALLAGVALNQVSHRAWNRQLLAMLTIAIVGLLASPLFGQMASDRTPNALYRLYAVWIAVAFVIMIAGILTARWLLWRRGRFASFACYALGMYLAFTVALLGHEAFGRSSSGAPLAPAIGSVLRPDMPLYGVRMLDHTLPFYLRHTLTMVEHADELAFGALQEPDKWVSDLSQFEVLWRTGPHALAILSRDTFRELSPRLPMHVIARDWRRVVVANFDPPVQQEPIAGLTGAAAIASARPTPTFGDCPPQRAGASSCSSMFSREVR